MTGRELFSSRTAIILAGLGMAVGTGNLWRFPRIAAQNGGAAFLIPWMIFLVTWSLPLLIAEFGVGRGARRGPIGSFAALLGRRYAWMGGFIVVVTVMIMFYYSVVTGWTLKYVLLSAFGSLPPTAGEYWTVYSQSVWQPIAFQVASILMAVLIVGRGVTKGIEQANRLLIPMLFLLLLVAVGRAVTLEGAGASLRFLFVPDFSALGNYRTWLEALTQSAWSTGAGWGLILTYAVYVHRNEDVVANAAAIGIGNNAASLLAGVAILPTVFAILSVADAEAAMASGNVGLTFVWVPQLFARIPGGSVLLPLFFLALFCAALSSLISMVELAARALIDTGLGRPAAVGVVGAAAVVGGLPSAASMTIFENQDWVWGLALMVSGLFVSLAVTGYGRDRFRNELVNAAPGVTRLGPAFGWLVTVGIPVQFTIMFGWWIHRSVTVYDPEFWFHPMRIYSLGTCVMQWGLALGLLWLFNDRLARAGGRPAGPGRS